MSTQRIMPQNGSLAKSLASSKRELACFSSGCRVCGDGPDFPVEGRGKKEGTVMNDPYLAEREMNLSTEEALAVAEQSRLRRLAKGQGEPRRWRLAPAIQSLKDFWMQMWQRLAHLGESST